jgi:TolA-binding protein
MKRSAPELDPELESLLHYRPVARHLPDDVRARVLARSRAFTSGRRAIAPVTPLPGPTPPATSSSQGSGLRRMAIAAAIAILAGAAGAVAALGSRTASAPPAASPASSGSLPIPVREEPGLDPELAALVAAPAAAPATAAHHAATSKRHPVLKARGADPLAEVELLQHAHLAYARRDFRSALALVAEHARRFPDGPLAEECEALRVESLLAAGHAVEARRVGARFAARFPRSVLLPGIVETSHEDAAP